MIDRYCTKETRHTWVTATAKGYQRRTLWQFHYNDGTVEELTKSVPLQSVEARDIASLLPALCLGLLPVYPIVDRILHAGLMAR